MYKLYQYLLPLIFSSLVYADETSNQPKMCSDYGCPKCDCVAQHPDLQDKIPTALSEIEKALIKNKIPIEAVTINIGGANTTAGVKYECSPVCKISLGTNCCWTFSILGPENTLNTKALPVK